MTFFYSLSTFDSSQHWILATTGLLSAQNTFLSMWMLILVISGF